MTITERFVEFQKSYVNNSLFSNQEAIACIDLTILVKAATPSQIETLAEKGNRYQVAAFCVYPEHLDWINAAPCIQMATVINFPEAKDKTQALLSQIETLHHNHPLHEIDYVFPYNAWLAGQEKQALDQATQVYRRCQQENLLLKIIMETGAISDLELIYKLSTQLITTGCDFLKTSTGKVPQGASPGAAFAILSAIKASRQPCGLKVSGGVKTAEQAFEYMTIAETLTGKRPDKHWFRIGASSLLDELV